MSIASWLVTEHCQEESGSIFPHSHQLFIYIDKVSPEHSHFQADQSQLSEPCPLLQMLQSLIISVALCWVYSSMSMPLILRGHIAAAVSQQCWVGRIHLPRPAGKCSSWSSSRHCWLPLLQGHFISFGLIWCPPGPSWIFLPSWFPACWPPACTGAWGYFFPGAGFSTLLCWALWDSHLPVSPQDVLLIHQPLLTVLYNL